MNTTRFFVSNQNEWSNLEGNCSNTILSQWFNWNNKTVFENLKNENINDEKYFPFLKTFSKYQLKALYENEIISEEKFNLLIPKTQKENQNQSSTEETNSTVNKTNTEIEEIISGDKIKELEKLLQEKDIKH